MENTQNKTIEDFLNDGKCKEFINKWMVEVRNKRHEAASKSKNGLKRSPYDALLKKGFMTGENLIQEYKLIIFKQSQLPSSERALIDGIVSDALFKTIAYYKEHASPVKKSRTVKPNN